MNPDALIHVVDDDESLRESLLDLLHAAVSESGAAVYHLGVVNKPSGAHVRSFIDREGGTRCSTSAAARRQGGGA